MVWIVLGVFFAGFALGRFIDVSWVRKYRVILVLTFFLLFSLGLRIGSNDELFGRIDEIAVNGLMIASVASAGSFLLGFSLERFVGKKQR